MEWLIAAILALSTSQQSCYIELAHDDRLTRHVLDCAVVQYENDIDHTSTREEILSLNQKVLDFRMLFRQG